MSGDSKVGPVGGISRAGPLRRVASEAATAMRAQTQLQPVQDNVPTARLSRLATSLADQTGGYFRRLVEASGNRVLLHAHAGLSLRLHRPRVLESAVFADAIQELRGLVATALGPELGQALRRYHRRRVARSEQIAALVEAG